MLLAFVAALLFSIPTATYYVNQLTGDDANAGTSPTAAFRTISAAQAVVTSGQSVAIYGGASASNPLRYREQFTLSGADIAVIGYGAAKPVLDASDAIPACNWIATPGHPGVYQATITTANTLGFLRAWEDDRPMFRAANLTALAATPGRYFVSGDPLQNGVITFTLWIHPIGNDDPVTNGKTYEFNKRAYGLFSTYAANVSGIRTRRNLCNNGSFEVGPGSTVSNVAADDGTKHNALIHHSSIWEDVTLTDSYYAGQNKIAIVLNDNNPGAGINGATLRRIIYAENLEGNGAGFYAHVNTGGKFGQVLLEDCATFGMVYASVSAISAVSLTITDGNFNGMVVLASDTNLLKNSTITGAQVQIPYSTAVELDHVTISGYAGPGLVRSTFNPTLNIHDCDFTSVIPYDGALYFNNTSHVAAFTLVNNIFRAPTSLSHLNGPGTMYLPSASVIDGNTYYYPSGGSAWLQFRGGVYNIANAGQWAAWQALGFDASGSRIAQ